MDHMNKSALAAAVASKTHLTKGQAATALNAALDLIRETVADGGEVRLSGFGHFKTKIRKARTGRNPSTGAEIEIPESRAMGFRPSKAKAA